MSIDERLASLTPAQRELLRTRMNKRGPVRPSPAAGIPARPGRTRARLSLDQERIWLIHQFDTAGPMYNVLLACRLHGHLDVNALRYAVNAVVRRHESLRTTFELAGSRPVQVIRARMPVPVPTEDLRAVPADEREEELTDRVRNEVRRPMDLVNGPLLRVVLYRTGDAEHVLVLTVDHLVWDRQSAGIFQEDLSRFYRARRAGREPDLPPLPIQFADYAEWQPGWIDREVRTRQLPYWKRALVGAPASLEIPPDRPRPRMQTFNGARYTFWMSRARTDALRALARAEKVTDYVALLAIWNLLLHRYTGESDIVVGTTSSTRSRPETERVIGYFLTMLPLRTRVTGDMTFREVLRATQQTMIGAMDHNDIPFGLLLDELDVPRDPARNPVYQNSFLFVNFREAPLDLDGVTVTPAVFDNRTAKDDCMVGVYDSPDDYDGFFGLIEYNTDLYDAETIDQLWHHFELLLDQATSAPSDLVGDYILASPRPGPAGQPTGPGPCAGNLILQQAERTPDRAAVTDGSDTLTYAEFAERARCLARYLRERGIGPERVVGVCLEHSVDLPVALVGVLLAGAAYLPLDPRHPSRRIVGLASDAGACLVLAREDLAESLGEAGLAVAERFPGTRAEGTRPPGPGEHPMDADDRHLAYVIYTSGSTGRPKGVGVEHRSLVNYLKWAREHYPASGGMALLHSSAAYDMAVTSLFLPLVSGGTVTVVPPDTIALGDRVRATADEPDPPSSAATLLKVTPSHLALLNAQPPKEKADVPEATLVVGGEALPAAELTAWRRNHPTATVVNEYGPTEATVGCVAYTLSAGTILPEGSNGVPIGQPVTGAEAYVLDARLQPVPDGVVGELYIAGNCLARGYIGKPDLTAERFIACPFGVPGRRMYRTGDLVRRRRDGNLEYLGRADRQIKVRGHRIEPAEVESCLTRDPDVTQAAVVVRDEPPGGKRIVAYVQTRAKGASADAILARAAAELPEHMVPSAVVALERLPLTASGKLDQGALPVPTARRAPGKRPARDVLELEVARIWEDVLGVHSIGVHDRFFDLGGHSMLALALVIETERRLGRRLPVESLFHGATVEQFAVLLREAGDGEIASRPASLVELRGGTGRPIYFPHLSGGEVACYGPFAGLLEPAGRPLYAILGPDLDDAGQLPYASFADQAASYADLIRERQPSGPYDIVGWSHGGTIAYGIAAELETRGARARLVLLGTSPPQHSAGDPPPDAAELVYGLAANLLSGQTEKVPSLARLRQMTPDERAGNLLAIAQAAGVFPPGADIGHMHKVINTAAANVGLYARHDLTPLASEWTLIRGEEESPGTFTGWSRPGWSAPRTHVTAGDHYTIMAHPHVTGVARLISQILGDGSAPEAVQTGSER